MNSIEELDLLLRAEVQQAIESNLERDPLEVALDKRIPMAGAVALQIKLLAKAKRKLPSYYAARAVLTTRAFEQSSSELTAQHKSLKGGSVLDLTCGLGVDTLYLSKRFDRVVALERDPLLARITAHNLEAMGVQNVEVLNITAEEYLSSCGERFDWVYVDPDRRTNGNERVIKLEDCSPNIMALMPNIRSISERLAIKNSPLFDVSEAFVLFPGSEVEVVSLQGECKEVMIYTNAEREQITANAVGLGQLKIAREDIISPPMPESFAQGDYKWLVMSDVSLRKSGLARHSLGESCDIWSQSGYGFARECPQGVLGTVQEIECIEPFNPKSLKRELKGQRFELLKRDFPYTAAQIAQKIGVKEGGAKRLAFTKIGDKFWTIRLK